MHLLSVKVHLLEEFLDRKFKTHWIFLEESLFLDPQWGLVGFAETYSGPYKTSMMEFFVQMVKYF